MGRKINKVGVTLLSVVSVGALLASCKTPIVQGACDGKLTTSTPGTIQDAALTEVSGLAASAKNGGMLWANNDSGDSARLFAISEAGATRGRYTLSGATAMDWEDLALGRGPVANQSYLYAADIGDNSGDRANIVVYRVVEPVLPAGGTQTSTMTGVDRLTLRYPDGAKDAEALVVDPWTGEIFIFQKSMTGGTTVIYRAPANLATNSTTVLTRAGTITLPAGGDNAITAADISQDGKSIAVRTYGGVRLWSRTDGQTLVEALSVPACRGPVPVESQGETVGFRPDAMAYYTLSEGSGAELHRFDAPSG
jgi:hypothetical protein